MRVLEVSGKICFYRPQKKLREGSVFTGGDVNRRGVGTSHES